MKQFLKTLNDFFTSRGFVIFFLLYIIVMLTVFMTAPFWIIISLYCMNILGYAEGRMKN